jgi:hypothetical protein
MAILVLPLTCLAGIDTYKWQGLATNVRLERCIPWLIHPLSLLGFTPRAYPGAQPLLLATVQIMGRLGVDWGYYAVSVLSGALGIAGAYALGRRLFGTPGHACWYAFLYAFSPVFMRYNHWATGRGLFLALLPLFLLSLVDMPRAGAWLTFALTAPLLPLCHKTGLLALALVLGGALLSPCLPRKDIKLVMLVVFVPFLALGIMAAPPLLLGTPLGSLCGFAFKAVARFGWYLPFSVAGLVLPGTWNARPAWRRLLVPFLAVFPLAFTADMYGALVALPFICLAATGCRHWLQQRFPARGRALAACGVILTVLAAGTIVVHRSANATPRRIRTAARFLNQYDPLGPYRVSAPGRCRQQIHAYVSGCPRFEIAAGQHSTWSVAFPPGPGATLVETVKSWLDYGRTMFEVSDVDIDWYGRNPRVYYVTIDGTGEAPVDTTRIYAHGGVVIRAPRGQTVPVGD